MFISGEIRTQYTHRPYTITTNHQLQTNVTNVLLTVFLSCRMDFVLQWERKSEDKCQAQSDRQTDKNAPHAQCTPRETTQITSTQMTASSETNIFQTCQGQNVRYKMALMISCHTCIALTHANVRIEPKEVFLLKWEDLPTVYFKYTAWGKHSEGLTLMEGHASKSVGWWWIANWWQASNSQPSHHFNFHLTSCMGVRSANKRKMWQGAREQDAKRKTRESKMHTGVHGI